MGRPLKSWVIGLTEVVTLLAAVGFVLGLFGHSNWFLDLFSHFRAQYAGALLGGGLVLLLLRQRRKGMACVLGGVVVIATMFCSFTARPAAAQGAASMRLLVFNVNTSNPRRDEVLPFLESEDPDVIFLMEVNDDWMQALKPLESHYPFRLDAPRGDNFGVALFSKIPLVGELEYFGDFDLPWIHVRVGDYRLIAVHLLPPSSRENSRLRNEQLTMVANLAARQPRTILCGDFNLTPYSPWFGDFLKTSGLTNLAPPFSPTWMRHYPLFALPLDHILLSPDLTFSRRAVGPALGSDHNAVV